jgi:ADP-ribose pyrophosphatase YjhB (NUDIX family)
MMSEVTGGHMITFDQGNARFNYRIVGIALHNNQVLLHKAEHENFWSLPGGRGELLESAENTLKREMREELGVEVGVERLVWVVENFFEGEEKSYHELALYFLMTLPHDSHLYQQREPFLGYEDFFLDNQRLRLIFQWFSLNELERLTLYPTFLKKGLPLLPSATQHVVHWDSEEYGCIF